MERSRILLPLLLLAALLGGCSKDEGSVAVVTATPTPPEVAQPAVAEDSPTAVVRTAVTALASRYFEPIDIARLYTDTWEGATAALAKAGVSGVPPAPAYPSDPQAAADQHTRAFPALEKLAEGKLAPQALTAAAVKELADRRADCHTQYIPTEQAQRAGAQPAGAPPVRIGLQLSAGPPLQIIDVVPGSPAQAAGLRSGQRVLAINGRSVDGLSAPEAIALLDPREGVENSFTVQDAAGRTREITVAPARLPLVAHETLSGSIGLIRFDGFPERRDDLLDPLRAALQDFEAQGVRGWIIDLRQNGGGSNVESVASLFVESGRLYGRTYRGAPTDYYRAETFRLALPFQRPLVILVGRGSFSAAEILAGSLQALQRATLVGEQTTGCIGGASMPVHLADGSILRVTISGVVIGPNDLRLNQIGVTPDVPVTRTDVDQRAGRDLQLEAAIRVVNEQTGDR